MTERQCPFGCHEAVDTFAVFDIRRYDRCRACGGITMDPAARLSPSDEFEHYKTHQNDPSDPQYREFLRPLAEELQLRLGRHQDGLDFGCGPGPGLAVMLADEGHRTALFDPFFHPDLKVLDQKYDFVICSEVAEHFQNPAYEFSRLSKMLRPGGWIGIMTSFIPMDRPFPSWHYVKDPTHVSFYTSDTLRRIADRNGLACEFPRTNVAMMQWRYA